MRNTCLRLGFVVAVFLFAGGGVVEHASAKDSWVRLRSANFVMVGNADQKKMRDIAIRLEQYRYVFTQLLSGLKFSSNVPSTIVVFKDMKSYGPFRTGNVAGYFQSGLDMNYLSLTAELSDPNYPYSTMFHEYTHLLVHNSNFSDVPAWFNEGLAEYYSSFDVSDDRKVKIGLVIPTHMAVLRREKLLPLSILFDVDHKSPYYNEGKKQSIFYAQSWLLVHYFIQQNNGARLPQLARFIELLGQKVPAESAFKQAFNAGYADIEKELSAYLKQDSHRVSVATFQEKLEASKEVAFEPLDEATALSYQGDLALHVRIKGLEEYFKKALALDANQPRALLGLGRFYVMTGEMDQAKPLLERAAAVDNRNGYAHYFYADALMKGERGTLTPEQIPKIRGHLKTAIELEPTFTESYRMYAYLSLLDGVEVDESVKLLEKAVTINPDRQELHFMLAQAYMRQRDYARAKALLQALIKAANSEELRSRSESLLSRLPDESSAGAGRRSSAPPSLVRRDTIPDKDPDPPADGEPDLRRVMPGETRVRGMLTAIECTGGKGVVLVIKTDKGTIRVQNDSLGSVEFTSFLPPDASGVQLKCGSITSTNSVLVTYIAKANSPGNSIGEALAVEFVSPDLKLP